MKSAITLNVASTTSLYESATNAIRTAGSPELLHNLMSATTAIDFRTALDEMVAADAVSWVMLYNSGKVLEGTDNHSWHVVSSSTIDMLDEPDVVFESIYHREVVFFTHNPGGEQVHVNLYTRGTARSNSVIGSLFQSVTIHVCYDEYQVRNLFDISSSKLDKAITEVVSRIRHHKDRPTAFIVAAIPESTHSSVPPFHWHLMVIPEDALTAHGSTRINELAQGFSDDITVAVVSGIPGEKGGISEKIRVQFYYDWVSMQDDPVLGKAIREYSRELPEHGDDVAKYTIVSRPLSDGMLSHHQAHYGGTDRILYTEAAFIGVDKQAILQLRDMSGKGRYWVHVRDNSTFEVCGRYNCSRDTYYWSCPFGTSNADLPLNLIWEMTRKTVRNDPKDRSLEQQQPRAKAFKNICRGMVLEAIQDTAETIGCVPVIHPDVMDAFLERVYEDTRRHMQEIEDERRAERGKTTLGRIINML